MLECGKYFPGLDGPCDIPVDFGLGAHGGRNAPDDKGGGSCLSVPRVTSLPTLLKAICKPAD